MPDFEFTSPAGKKYTVSGPAGSTAAQAFQILQTQLGVPAPKSPADQIPGSENAVAGNRNVGQPEPAPSFIDRVTGGIEAARNLVSGLTTGAVGQIGGTLGGIAGSIASGEFGTKQGADRAEEVAGEMANNLTYAPKTALGQQYAQKVGDAIHDSGIIGVPIPEMEALGRGLPQVTRNRIPGPAKAPEVVPVNYDTPTYVRQGITPVEPSLAAPTYAPSQLAHEIEKIKAQRIAPVEPVPVVTPPEVTAKIASPLDIATREEAPLAAPVADTPAARIAAPLRDTSDIDAMLAKFGVGTPETPVAATLPMEPVERAAGQIAPLDASLVVPERIPGPIASEAVPRATEPAAPIDNSMVAPEPAAASKVVEEPFVPTPEQHVDPARREQHLQVLRDIGLENKRESAVTGNAAQAAREYQMGKFDEPAGHHWDAQFRAETDAMKNYANQIVADSKGRTGLDSEALEAKGRDIAAPYDAARKYFEDAKADLYTEADKAAAGKPLPSTESIDSLFVDRSFNNAALADDQMNLVSAAKNQFELHKERNSGAMTVKEAEDYRKWLNQRWTPANSKIIAEIKEALDKDVFAAAGDDIYAAARRLHQEEMRVLDDPTGISKLFDSDPRTPMNRATAYEAIPNGLVKLSNEQFKHIIDTYKSLPPELQPLAQQAIATMKAHYAERMANAGVETAKGNPRGLWDAGGVKVFAERNSGKLPLIFDATEMHKINTLLQAGDILRTNPAYPGAGAQVANATKAGMMSHVAGKVTGGIGSAIGAMFGGPVGAGAGALAGDAVGTGISNLARERRALAAAKEQIVTEHNQSAPRKVDPVTEWENENR